MVPRGLHEMKTTALLLSLLLFAACASPTAVIDKHTFRCEPGQDISIAAGFDPGNQRGELGEREFLVEVSNNSHADVTVTSVQIEPSDRNRGLPGAYEKTDVTIAEGESHLFHLRPTSYALEPRRQQSTLGPSNVMDFFVMVRFSNGDAYRCPFRVDRR